MEVYPTLFGHTEKITLLSYVAKKSNVVCVLLTMSHDWTITEEEDKKHEIILDYNKYKGGVDTMDHLATNYSDRRNTRRWPMTLCFNMLDVGGIASYVMWNSFYLWTVPIAINKQVKMLVHLCIVLV